MHDKSFVQAFVHDEVIRRGERYHRNFVLGARLRPYSLWHQLLLESIGSPFVVPSVAVTPADLRRAVAVCRCRYPETSFHLPVSLSGLWSVIGKGAFAGNLERFLEYRRDYVSLPEYSFYEAPKQQDGMPAMHNPTPCLGEAPGVLRVWSDVMNWLKGSPSLVWDMPFGEAYWYRAMGQQANGSMLDFVTAQDREEQDRFEREHPEQHAALMAVAEALRRERR